MGVKEQCKVPAKSGRAAGRDFEGFSDTLATRHAAWVQNVLLRPGRQFQFEVRGTAGIDLYSRRDAGENSDQNQLSRNDPGPAAA